MVGWLILVITPMKKYYSTNPNGDRKKDGFFSSTSFFCDGFAALIVGVHNLEWGSDNEPQLASHSIHDSSTCFFLQKLVNNICSYISILMLNELIWMTWVIFWYISISVYIYNQLDSGWSSADASEPMTFLSRTCCCPSAAVGCSARPGSGQQ